MRVLQIRREKNTFLCLAKGARGIRVGWGTNYNPESCGLGSRLCRWNSSFM